MADFLQVCEQAARAGGEALRSWIGRFEVREKGPSDLVTEADFASQAAIRQLVLGHFPDHAFVGEEEHDPADLSADYCWIVDPLDGTTNYVHQLPHYCVSIALARRGEPIVGTIYDPVSQECYTTERGSGAFLNGRRLKTSGAKQLSEALVVASFSARVKRESIEIDQFIAALLACQGVRRTGSAALNMCYLAAGRVDGFWALSTKAWDVAAGVLLVEEAGGVVTNLHGAPLNLVAEPHPIASATPELHEKFRQVLLEARR